MEMRQAENAPVQSQVIGQATLVPIIVPTQPAGVPTSQPNHLNNVNSNKNGSYGGTSDVAIGESILRIFNTVSCIMDNTYVAIHRGTVRT